MVRYRRCTCCKKIKRIVSGFEIPCIHKSFELCEECNKKVMENLRKTVKKNERKFYLPSLQEHNGLAGSNSCARPLCRTL